MALLPLNIPPGQYRNGTEYQAAGRWRDATLVRWHEGALRPVGGWRQRGTVDIAGVVRGMHAWEDESANRRVAFGAHNKLFAMTAGNSVADITPAGLTAGRVDATINTGYGAGTYGSSLYGTQRPDTGSILPATTWSLDNWGEYLLACSPDDGRIYEWQLNAATPAAVLTNAPVNNTAMMVTEERFVFALGAGGDGRAVAWSDREDNTTWATAATNQAGTINLQTNGNLMRGVRTRGQALLLTDQDAHTATYRGRPFIYGFERVGTSCGLIAPLAAVSTDAGVIWMGLRSFHIFAGGTVNDIPCEVADYVFSDMNVNQRSKIAAVVNAKWGEIWWFYPSAASIECDRYVVFNYQQQIWATGSMARTSGVDAGIFRQPFWVAPDGVLYEHEIGYEYGGATPFAESGPISLGIGEQMLSAVELIPDERTQGQTQATFKTRFYPNDTERTYGPYSMANPTPVRFTGRQVRLRVEGLTASDWRVGVPRLDVRAGGSR